MQGSSAACSDDLRGCVCGGTAGALSWGVEREPLQKMRTGALLIAGGIALLAGTSLPVLCRGSQASGSRDKQKKKLLAGSRF